MNTVEITKRMAEGSPRSGARFVPAYYLLSILTGMVFFFVRGRLAFAADLVAGVFYFAATVLLYALSTRRNESDHSKKEQRV